ncbi:protein NDR1-like [Papaver somniferum]|uniref:protein NDR1-like n=1 Tax=Papaver somniferum TaxID=3469 RepID=UPI000E6F89B0|nr:protein NDR1-like [Papaver somniferum]
MSMKICCRRSLVVLVGLSFLFSSPVVGSDAYDNFPKCTIEDFYVPALNKASNDATNSTINTTISFDLRLKIEIPSIWRVDYNTFNITLYYYHNGSSATGEILIPSPIGNICIPKFSGSTSENPQHHVVKVQTFGIPWEEARIAVSNGGTTTFRVELASRVSYEMLLIKFFTHTKTGTVEFGANVTVNDQGNKSVSKGLRLTSSSRRINIHPSSFFLLALSVLSLIL